MRLEQLYKNFGTSSPEEQLAFVSAYRLRRAQDLETIPTTVKKKQSVAKSKIDLSEEEKALIKVLGIKQKDFIALKATLNTEETSSSEEDEILLNDSPFVEED